MNITGKITALLLTVFAAMLPLHGDELDNYSKMLDRVENGFWRAAFSKIEASRSNYKSLLSSMRNCAKRINQLEYINSVPRNSGDLTSNILKIEGLLTDNGAFRKKNFSFNNLKKSSISEYCKFLAKEKRRSSKVKVIKYEELSLAGYRDFLNQIKDENINIAVKRFSSARELNRGQQKYLIETANAFYSRLYELRATVLLMRQKHPVFKPQK